MGTMPPWPSAMAVAMGVVTDLGSSDTVRDLSSPNRRHSTQMEPTEATAPAVHPTSTGSKLRKRVSRWA